VRYDTLPEDALHWARVAILDTVGVTLAGASNYDAEAILHNWANPLDITRPGVAIKQYPCCGSTHPVVDAMLVLVLGREQDIAAASIERVDAAGAACRSLIMSA
jgi:2-methylcitrate dehydratase PrpD